MIGKNWFLASKIDNQFIELGGMLEINFKSTISLQCINEETEAHPR